MNPLGRLATVLAVASTLAACKKDESSKPTEAITTAPRLVALQRPDDPTRGAKVALGHALFFDKRLSVDGSRACYSCHLNEDGNGGHDPLAIGPGDKKLPRHSPIIWNVGYWKGALMWDGRTPTLEAQAKGAIGGPNMAVGTEPEKLKKKVDELAAIAGYKPLFEAAFPGKPPNVDLVSEALAEYERTLVCNETAYDKFAAGDAAALDASQKRGWELFNGAAGCSTCHAAPLFSVAAMSDGGVYYNVGIGTKKPDAEVDVGRKKVSNADADWAAFKVPTLRNVSKSAPYFHDGSVAKLEDAVKLMVDGGIDNKGKTPALTRKTLAPAQLADLIAFLHALDCPGKLVEPPLPK